MRFVNKCVCLIVLEAAKSQITVLTESVSGEKQLPHGCLSFHGVLTRGEGALWGFLL